MYNPAAVLLFPFPDFFDKFLSAKFMSAQPMLFGFFFRNILRCDAGMVCAGKPESIKARHPLPSYDYILKSNIKGMPYVEGASNIWRRYNYTVRRFFALRISQKVILLKPEIIPFLLYAFWIVTFVNHGLVIDNELPPSLYER